MRVVTLALFQFLYGSGVALADPLTIGSAIGLALFNATGIGIASATALTAIGYAAITAATVGLQILLAGNQSKVKPQSIKTTVKASEGAGRYALGRVEVAGKIGFANTKGYLISRLLFHSFGEADEIEEYIYDGREIIIDSIGNVVSPPWVHTGGSYMNLQSAMGTGNETAWGALVADFPGQWTSDHRARGIFQTLMRIKNPGTGSDKFPKLLTGGVKELKVVARVGQYYDPRDAGTRWTLNGVLHCLHWMKQLPGISASKLDQTSIGAIATQAEVFVPTLTGTAPRCQLSGGWEGSLTTDIIEDMMTSSGIEMRITDDGLYTFAFIEDDPESEITITSNHIIDRDYKSGPDSAQRPNICKVEYFSPERRYEMSEIDLSSATWARIPSEIISYGEQEFRIQLPFCMDASQAQRIARRLFHMARTAFGTIVTNFAGNALMGKKTAMIEIPDIGVNGASVFIKCRLGTIRVSDADGICDVQFQVIPDELKIPWDASTMEQPAPPVLAVGQYEAVLARPNAPSGALTVQYPSGSYEARVSIVPVSGSITSEVVYRTYTGGLPNSWQPMTQNELTNAWVTGSLIGVQADFRVRFIDANDDSSHFSPEYQITGAPIDNTPLSAPSLSVSGANNAFVASVTIASNLNATSAKVQYRKYATGSPSGTWIDVDTRNVRPLDSYSVAVNFGANVPGSIAIRVVSYTSSGIASSSVEFVHDEVI